MLDYVPPPASLAIEPARPALVAAASTPPVARFVLQRPLVSAVRRPPIRWQAIPFDAQRKRDTAAYMRRHYGLDRWRLERPRTIVQHIAVAPSVASVRATFAPNRRDGELGELPGLCAHFVIDRDGTIVQLVPIGIVCRHTVGLNHVAIGIEHVGYSDAEVLGNPRQLSASLRLTRWLRCRARIGVRNVIGHNESLRSPYHHELVVSLRRQTHGDFRTESMRVYRRALARLGRCP